MNLGFSQWSSRKLIWIGVKKLLWSKRVENSLKKRIAANLYEFKRDSSLNIPLVYVQISSDQEKNALAESKRFMVLKLCRTFETRCNTWCMLIYTNTKNKVKFVYLFVCFRNGVNWKWICLNESEVLMSIERYGITQ